MGKFSITNNLQNKIWLAVYSVNCNSVIHCCAFSNIDYTIILHVSSTPCVQMLLFFLCNIVKLYRNMNVH